MQLFFTSTTALEEQPQEYGQIQFTSQDCKTLGLVDGMPFVLDHDGSYDHHLNRFFRALPTEGAPSPHSWRGVAMDVVLWMRFLRARGKTIWSADNTDLSAFWIVRRLNPVGRARPIKKSTWSRWVSSLDKFYTWALHQRLVTRPPFTYKSALRLVFETGERIPYVRNQAHERGSRRVLVKYLNLEQYLFFRDVGLRGRLPEGTPDPRFRGRNGNRNATFAELLVNTGVRNGEASYLLVCEIPDPGNTAGGSLSFYLPVGVTKGGVEREIWLPVRVLRLLHAYIQIEREVSLSRAFNASAGGEYKGIAHPIHVVQDPGRRAYRVPPGAGLIPLATLSREKRGRIVETRTGEPPRPAIIWLTEQGRPMNPYTWSRAFKEATHRCRRFEQWNTAIEVTPHTLRHTFAVNMLAELTRAYYGQFSPELLRNDLVRAELDLTINPLLRVQRLLGHRHLQTTMVYLEYMDEARDVVEAASAEWAARTTGRW